MGWNIGVTAYGKGSWRILLWWDQRRSQPTTAVVLLGSGFASFDENLSRREGIGENVWGPNINKLLDSNVLVLILDDAEHTSIKAKNFSQNRNFGFYESGIKHNDLENGMDRNIGLMNYIYCWITMH